MDIYGLIRAQLVTAHALYALILVDKWGVGGFPGNSTDGAAFYADSAILAAGAYFRMEAEQG